MKNKELAQDVRVLRCGNYGYRHKGKVIFKSKDLKKVNDFSNFCNSQWVKMTNDSHKIIMHEAKKRQELEKDFFTPHFLPTTKGERIVSVGNNYESVRKEPLFKL